MGSLPMQIVDETAEIIALKAFGHIISDDPLRDRFVALTGLEPAEMRAGLANRETLLNILDFLIAHEPDLIAAAEAQAEKPEVLVAAWRNLGGGAGQEW